MTEYRVPLKIDYPASCIERWTLSRPEVYNALNLDLLELLYSQVELLKDRQDIKVVILQGAGKGFCSGHDIRELTRISESQAHELCFRQLAQLVTKFHRMHQVIISGIHGSATAGGCLLAAASDIIIAEKTAKFSTSGINVGLFCFTPMVALYNEIPNKVLLEMLLTGRILTAIEAEAYGFVNKLVPAGAIADSTLEYAINVTKKIGYGLSDGKRSFYQLKSMSPQEQQETAVHMMVNHFNKKDTKDLVKEFMER